MEGELEEARTCYLEDDDTQDLDKNGLLSGSARRSLLEKNAPKRCGNLSSNWPFQSVQKDLLSVEEYIALQTLAIARNYDGIAHAQAEKPKRQIDRDALIPEQPLYVEGVDGTSYGGEGQIENLGDDRTASLRQNVHLAHRFEEADLKDILAYDTAERRQAFVKELEEIAFMHDGELPPPTDRKKVEIRREDLSDRFLTPFQGLAHLDDLLTDVIARQRTTFGAESSKACPANNPEGDTDVPPEPGEPVAKPDEQDAKACSLRLLAPPQRLRCVHGETLRNRLDEPPQREKRTATPEARPGAVRRPVRSYLQYCMGRGSQSRRRRDERQPDNLLRHPLNGTRRVRQDGCCPGHSLTHARLSFRLRSNAHCLREMVSGGEHLHGRPQGHHLPPSCFSWDTVLP